MDVMAGPAHLADLVSGLEARGIEHSVMIEDVERLSERTKMTKGPRDMDWDSYHPIEDMYAYFDYLGWSSNLPQHSISSFIMYQSLNAHELTSRAHIKWRPRLG